MQSAPNSLPTPPLSTAQQQQQQQQQPQQMAYEPQYYYAAPMQGGGQPMQNYMAGPQQQQAANGYYPDGGQYQQQQQQMMMAAPQPYYYMPQQQQQPNNQGGVGPQQQQQQPAPPPQMYYPQPMVAPNGAMYYQPMPIQQQMLSQEQMAGAAQMQMMAAAMAGVPQQAQQQQQQMQVQQVQQPHQQQMTQKTNDNGNQRPPLTSSTPLPTNTEYEVAAARNKNIQFRYHRVIEHDDDVLPIDEISKITIDHPHDDDTLNAEKENHQMGDGRMDRGQGSEKLGVRRSVNNGGSDRNGGGGQFNHGGDSQNSSAFPSNYKTRLCMMHASGTKPCEMGSRCKFAHGVKELRATEMQARFTNNKYKTKLCKNFARGGTGFCPYGLRCEFVHPTDKEFQSIPVYQRMLVDEKLCDQDVTPEMDDYGMTTSSISKRERFYQHMSSSSGRGAVSSSSKANHPAKVLLKHRNVAGSMVCLSQTGKDSGAGGDFNNKSHNSQENLPPHMRPRNNHRGSMNGQLSKHSRRMSLSQLKTKWTSEENVSQY